MARTLIVPTADGSAVYVERGAAQAVLYAPGLHALPVVHDRAHGDRWDMTTCGRLVFDTPRGDLVPSAVLLRLDHALAFGRPCRRCWP